eukprot:541679_1
MRDEIRGLLELGGDHPEPLLPINNNNDNDNNNDSDDGITPGGPANYDPTVLNDVLNDLRREQKSKSKLKPKLKAKPKARRKSMEPVMVYNPNNESRIKNNKRRKSESIMFDSLMSKFSPHKMTSPNSIHKQVKNTLTNNTKEIKKKHKKNSYVAKRTVPSPLSPQQQLLQQ